MFRNGELDLKAHGVGDMDGHLQVLPPEPHASKFMTFQYL